MSVIPTEAERPRKLRRSEYDILVAAGAFEGEAVELLFGEILPMSPQGPEHRLVSKCLRRFLDTALPKTLTVDTHSPVMAAEESEPEPAIAVYPLSEDSLEQLPQTLLFIIEVARTSQKRDLGAKALLYALSGVPEYWVIDLPVRAVRVHTEPGPEGYQSIETYPITRELVLVVPSCDDLVVPLGRLAAEVGLL